ncbi:bifunctional nuclease 2-like isoform X2 [Aristolochia californica]|uniref:bifunctional nuclease 2-like isoform X2 n=1 Tax=Aristolochia californica TaxID=171875 RepID=UPI0035D89B1B
MRALQAPVICPTISAREARICGLSGNALRAKGGVLRSGFWGSKGRWGSQIKVKGLSRRHHMATDMTVRCSFSSSSNGNGSMAENFNENDEDYVNSSVVEAVEVKSGADGFLIKMRDGRYLRCVHNNPQGGHLLDYAPHPAIVLKMEDGSDLLLPIIVLEMPSVLLMAAIRNVQIARPTLYQILKEMTEKMGYTVELVRVTKRVHEAYFAQLYLTKVGDEAGRVSFDLRPSDAINIAVRCKIPIQVNKHLAYSDGMRVVDPAKLVMQAPLSDGLLFAQLDRPDGQPCFEAKEFDLIRNMLIAAVEERYRDAAQYRDKLFQLRSKRRNWP